jgi:hypothetical protein
LIESCRGQPFRPHERRRGRRKHFVDPSPMAGPLTAQASLLAIFGPKGLRQIPRAYADYYNRVRTHLALEKDAPFHRLVKPTGLVVAILSSVAFIINTLGRINGRHN